MTPTPASKAFHSRLARLACVAALLFVALGVASESARASEAAVTAAGVEVDGRPFVTAAGLRNHVVRSGRSWEAFLDRNPAVVRAFRLRHVWYAGRTYYSRAGLAYRLWLRGSSYRRWARAHPVRAARLRRNRIAKIRPGAKSPTTVASPPAPAPAPAPAAAPGARVGVSLDNPEYAPVDQRDRQLDEVRAVGAGWVRFDIKWTDVQYHGASSFDWAKYDPLVDGARARGLQVLANLAYSPAWARPAATSDKFAPDTHERRDAYARFAAAAAAHFRGRVSAWEIWNEPNNTMFWQPAPNASSYAALLRYAYPAIKGADSAVTVIGGATSPAATWGGMIDEVQFLQGVYAAGGGGHFDAWSHHPYDFNLAPGTAHKDSAWWQMYGSTPSIRSVMEASGDGAKKLWATEHGVPSASYGSLNESTQATWLGQAHELWRGFAWAGPLFNYMVRDSASPGNAGYWYYMGLSRGDWSRKPAFSVVQQAAAAP